MLNLSRAVALKACNVDFGKEKKNSVHSLFYGHHFMLLQVLTRGSLVYYGTQINVFLA